ncbi:Drug resistance transporter Bcr/CmlA subfamily [Acididesulfobacillus acetoxydans]|uniref:Bcr/CflA family efflux transporter n=1 Tax=Acididesulfobacillus acetoxydans TaxID=1561005 RepID=A0A8S0WMU1_9FIRM|nr:multidrug effflux MFS transporter [Acididesulfobacillus acetoxydans]CAA7600784.1 Drug resistance transporter Bcr/CmlA subfamily [Acididesulfobacillus acetoxydans]CEJ08632.1 Bicyclomycin resistance protein [Acididesulfobacillus acetoxydans]
MKEKYLGEDLRQMKGARRLGITFVLGALAAFGPLSIDMYLPSLPSLTRDLHTTASLAQLSLTACLLGLSVGQLLAGAQSDVRGRRMPLLVGLVAYAASSILCAFTPSVWSLILLRFIQGLAGSAGIVVSRAVVRDLYSGTEMTRFTARLMLVNGAAPILAPIIGGQLLEFTTWRGVFVVLFAVGTLMLLSVLFGLPETLPAEARSRGGLKNTLETFGTLLKDREFMAYALSQGFVTGAMFAYISGSPFVIQNIYGVSPQGFSLIFAMNGLGIILAGQITGKLADRIRLRTLFLAGLALAAAGGVALLAVILLKIGLFAILPPLFVVVSCVGIVGTAGSSLAMENYGRAAGSASAVLGLLSFIFGAIVAPLVGLGGSNTAVPMGIIIAVIEVCALLLYVFLGGRGKREQAVA